MKQVRSFLSVPGVGSTGWARRNPFPDHLRRTGPWPIWPSRAYCNRGRSQALRQVQLDVVLETTTAFLGILQARSFVRIQNENVNVTKNNYDIAKAKESVGYSGASDLNRWASELALKNVDLTDAYAQLRQAQFNLNLLLNRPIKEVFRTEEVTLR